MNIKYLLLFVMLSVLLRLQAQGMPEEYKQELINSLSITTVDSIGTIHYAPAAIEEIRRFMVREAVPEIIENLWIQDPFYQIRFLIALRVLGSPEAETLTLVFIDSVGEYTNSYFSKLALKVMATKNLFYMENYSTYNYVFEIIDSTKPDIYESGHFFLEQIIKNIPNEAERAKNELIRIVLEGGDEYQRWYALNSLSRVLGEEAITILVESFIQENSENRSLLAKYIFPEYYSEEIEQVLGEVLNSDTSAHTRCNIVDELITKYGSFKNHKFVLDYLENETDEKVHGEYNYSTISSRPNYDSSSTNLTLLDSLISNTNQCYGYEWLKDEVYKNELLTKLTNAINYLNTNDSLNCRIQITEFQNIVDIVYRDSLVSYPKYVSREGYKFLYHYAQYIIDRLPEPPVGLPVKLQNSQGNLLQEGTLQYYDSGWQDAIDNGNGIFTVQTERTTVSLKMLYAGGNQQINNVTVGQDTAIFQTVNTMVKLLNSQNTLIDSGMVKYYASGWKDLGATVNGVATKELLPRQYTFRMEFGGANQDLAQGIDTNATVVFQTTNATVKLLNSQNGLMDEGIVKYYASGWKDLGTTVNGIATKELLPRQYTFRMEYGGTNEDKAQDVSSNSVVVYQTVNAEVQLKDSQGNSLDGGVVKYYASGWKDFGTATNGTTSKELLPRQYTFRMEYGGTNEDKAQDISSNPVVVYQTVNAEVQLKDSQGNSLDGGVVKYYASGWKDFGIATNGTTNKELLPRQYTFRMEYGGTNEDKSQDISSNSVVVFQTVNAEVQLKDSQGNSLDGGVVKYYASGWKDFGIATNGTTSKELLSRQYTFRMEYGGTNEDKSQDISSNSVVVYQTVNAEVQLKDSQDNFMDEGTVQYYASGWKEFGTTQSGITNKELLGRTYTFRMTHEKVSNDKSQDVSVNNAVIFSTVLTNVQVKDVQNQPIENAEVLYYSAGWNQIGFTVNGEITKELLPKNITFRAKQGTTTQDKQQDTAINNIVEIILE